MKAFTEQELIDSLSKAWAECRDEEFWDYLCYDERIEVIVKRVFNEENE